MGKRVRRLVSALILAVAAAPVAAQQQGPQLRTSAVELSVGGRLHTQLNTTSIDGQPPSQLFFRRARLEIGVRIDERISGVLQPDFGDGGVELKDAYLQVDLSPAFGLLVGQAYRPFGLLEQTSSKRMLPIERGLRIRGLSAADAYALTSGLGYSNRDIGVQLLGAPTGAPLGLAYAAGVFRGPLHGLVGAQDSYQLAARATVRPAAAVRVGAGWSSRDFAGPDGDTPALRRGHAFEVDLEYGSFAPGFHLLAELARGDLEPFGRATFHGGQAWLGYRTGQLGGSGVMLEPLVRISHAETRRAAPGPQVPGGTLLTPGLNLYLDPLNRLMVGYDVWYGADGSPDARSLKVMAQLAF